MKNAVQQIKAYIPLPCVWLQDTTIRLPKSGPRKQARGQLGPGGKKHCTSHNPLRDSSIVASEPDPDILILRL
jgi:hypothetical protein